MQYVGLDPYHLTLLLVAIISGVISPVLVQATRYYFSNLKKKSACMLSSNIKKEDYLSTKLDKIRENYKADRVWVIEFHNGGHTFTGKSMQKFSEVYEETQVGVSTEASKTQNLPTSLFSKFFNELVDNNFIYFKDISKIGQNSIALSMNNFFESRGITSFFATSLVDMNGSLIGVLCLDGVKNVLDLSEKNIINLKNEAYFIGGYLSKTS